MSGNGHERPAAPKRPAHKPASGRVGMDATGLWPARKPKGGIGSRPRPRRSERKAGSA